MLECPIFFLFSVYLFEKAFIKSICLFRKETIKDDSKVILKSIGIFGDLQTSHVTCGKGSEETIEEYFSDVDAKTLDRLYKLYEMDFVLFNYTAKNYYQLVENEK